MGSVLLHDSAEANYLLRERQHLFNKDDISIAKTIVINKIQNQHKALANTRLKNSNIELAKQVCTNATMDIGYTILFNFIEVYARMFGFDLYVGVYHRLWFKRKSLICDIIEPFRPIIDSQIRKSYNLGQFKDSDFEVRKHEYIIRNECRAHYYKIFYNALIDHKMDIFKYVQSYYRCFMGKKSVKVYPMFNI